MGVSGGSGLQWSVVSAGWRRAEGRGFGGIDGEGVWGQDGVGQFSGNRLGTSLNAAARFS